MAIARFEAMLQQEYTTMSELEGVTRAKWSLAAWFLSQVFLLGGCQAPWEPDDGGVDDDDDGNVDDDDDDEELGGWTAFTSEEYAALSCPDGQAVQGADCEGSFCDDVALYCAPTGWASGATAWLPYFSEEGAGAADEGHCLDDDMWMTGINCKGGFCDGISMQCTQMIGSTTGACQWSGWYSEEQAPFYAPADHYIKGIECAGAFCDRKRYRYCHMS